MLSLMPFHLLAPEAKSFVIAPKDSGKNYICRKRDFARKQLLNDFLQKNFSVV
jgi:hypothetical protein